MHYRTIFSGTLLLAACAGSFAQEAVAGQLVVRYKPNTNIAAINSQIGATVINFNAALNLATIKLPGTISAVQADTWLTNQPGVMYAEPNYIYRATFIPNDPFFSSRQYAPQKINATTAWDRHQGSASVVIAIIDTGVDGNHPDLNSKMVAGYDFVNDDADPMDDHGHGTHVAGTAAAVTNNGVGVAGIAPGCRIMPIKVLGAGGSGSIDWIVDGITFAADNGAKVINLSLGGGSAAQAYKDAGAYALSKGVLPIAAAGNNGSTNMFYPAGFDEYLAVAATDRNDLRANFSNHGASWVDVAAPGVDVYATTPGNSYGYSSGTSMASPVVAGVAGVIRSADPSLTPAATRILIQNGCQNVGPFVKWGRVNLNNSLPTTVTTTPIDLAPAATSVYEGTLASGTNASVLTSDNVYYRINAKQVLRTGRVATAQVTMNAGTNNPANFKTLALKVESAAVNGVTVSGFIWDRTLNGGVGGWAYIGSTPLTGADKAASFIVAYSAAKHFDASKNVKFLVRAVYPDKSSIPAQNFQLKVDKVHAAATVANSN